MISSAVSFRSALREPHPTAPAPPTGHECPQDARDAGWLGQVPPPTPSAATTRDAAAAAQDTPPLTGHESARDARDAGWLGQVPPPSAPPRDAPGSTPVPTSVELGNETAHERREHGWLGQVPPPSAPATPVDDAPATTYANPQLAPEPWKDSGSLFPNDPTLFG